MNDERDSKGPAISRKQFLGGALSIALMPAARGLHAQEGKQEVRIRKVEPVMISGPTREKILVMVRVTTDQGLTGTGECFPWREPVSARTLRIPKLIASVGDAIVGDSACNVNAFLTRFRKAGPPVAQATAVEWSAALSAIEIAMWDIAGQVAGLPIHALLGGAVRATIPTYANHGIFASAATSEEKLERALRARELGFDMFKWDPFHHGGNPDRAVIEKEIKEVALFRKGFGDEFKLAVDAHARFETSAALIAAKGLEPFNLVFFEEPVAPGNLDGYRQVAQSTKTPIASGERLANLEDTRAILETRALSFLQLEPGNVGGLLEAARGAAMAETFGVKMVPHDWVGPVLTRATTHLCATLPNLFRQEYPSTAREDAWENDLLDPPTVIKGGQITVPNGPGLGSRLNEKVVAARKVAL